jgi:hypothetical protein
MFMAEQASGATVRLSRARALVWGAAAVAAVLLAWHVYGVVVAPYSAVLWFCVIADAVALAICVWQGLRWPPTAVFADDHLRLGSLDIPYASIDTVWRGTESAKPFWLAFWLPQSLLGGLVVALVPAGSFDRYVLQLDAAGASTRMRFRNHHYRDRFLEQLDARLPGLDHRYTAGPEPAVDVTPRLAVPGGLLLACLTTWILVGGWFGTFLFDLSLEARTTSSGDTTSATLRAFTGRLENTVVSTSGTTAAATAAALGPLTARIKESSCDYREDEILGAAPGIADYRLEIEGRDVPKDRADALEAVVRHAVAMSEDTYYVNLDTDGAADTDYRMAGTRTAVTLDIYVTPGVGIDVESGCVATADEARIRADLMAVAAALNAQ